MIEHFFKVDVDGNITPLNNIVHVNGDNIPDGIVHDIAVRYLIEKIHPIAFSEKDDIYVYINGVYKEGGCTLIKEILNKGLLTFRNEWSQPIVTKKETEEIIEKIRFNCMCDRSEFDKDLKIINMKNGLYNWATGEFKEHDPNYKSLIQIPVIYDLSADCPTIIDVMMDIIPKEYYELCLDYITYLLYRSYNIKSFIMLYGPPGTGKSVFMDILKNFVGANNCSYQSLFSLVNNKYSFAELYGKLLNVCGDLDGTAISQTGLFKQATGRDMLQIDRKYLSQLAFYNFAKFLFGTNVAPVIKDESNAFIKRLVIIKFLRVFKEEEYDFERIDRCSTPEELSGLFNLVVKRMPELIRRNALINTPDENFTRAEYDALSDPLKMFARDCIFEDPESKGIFKTYLYKQYSDLCIRFKAIPLHYNDFNRELQKHVTYIKNGQKVNNRTYKRQAAWSNVSLTHVYD